ncbi:dihydrolipoyl dehydrogenase [Paracoccus sp. (in: a-proteobacteria)]|uniref:dihydrolipoyl dehydrogenase n=1 Tax=Paracoccus sp. TaxID=267 RepID=UPI003A86486D
MRHEACKLLVIGAGPGGYVCAIRAGQAGLDTIVVDEGRPGGTCLNVGCIPSKALIHAADEFHIAAGLSRPNALGITTAPPAIDLGQTVAWKDGIVARLTGGVGALLKKAAVRVIAGRAVIVDGKTVEVAGPDGPLRIAAERIVIATGSRPQELPALPFGGDILSSTEALSLDRVPDRLAVVGGGYIGLEIGTAMAKLGAQVTVVEAAARILPQYDAELTQPVLRRLATLGVTVLTRARAASFSRGSLAVTMGDEPRDIPADKVLVAVGRAPVTDGFGLKELGLTMNGRYLAIDDRCQTSMRGVYAIGDVTGDPMLAHRAMAQGALVAGILSGSAARWDKRAIPAVCYTDPEIVTVGKLPGNAPDEETALFPFAGNGRAMTLGRDDGFVRIVFRKSSGLVTGIQAVGPGVSELAGEFALALEMAATLTDIAETIHAHPTLGETVQEATMKARGQALHI